MSQDDRKFPKLKPAPSDEPIQLVPGQDDEDDRTSFRAKRSRKAPSSASDQTPLDGVPPVEQEQDEAADNNDVPITQALRWALDSMHEPAMASADWLARDIDPSQPSATALLTNPNITLTQVQQAKSVFKTMRIVGEKAADRRVGARMYAAAIAAGIVRFDRKVSTQSESALKRGFEGLLDDRRMPQELRDLAGKALARLKELGANGALGTGSRRRSQSA